MFCNQCGTQVEDDVKFCPNCGAEAAPAVPQEASAAAAPQQPMGWYKFLIYFALFAGAVLNLINGIRMLTGTIYGDKAALVYAVFENLKGLDSIMGIAMLALAAFLVYIRFQLAGYKKSAPKLVVAGYAADLLIAVVYIIGINAILPPLALQVIDMTSMYVSLAVSVVMMIVNHIYFKKRADLFVK